MPVLTDLLDALAFLFGLVLVGVTLTSAVGVLVLPRSVSDPIARATFLTIRRLFGVFTAKATTYEARDRIMAPYAPVGLLTLVAVWLVLVLAGFTGMFWALGIRPLDRAFKLSGSSLLTLGFSDTANLATTILSFVEAAIGLTLIALLIAYLPTIYAAFSRREAAVTMLEVRAGSPPSATEMITRYHRIQGLGHLGELWPVWEAWFADVEETHTSIAALAFFRSPLASRSWITAAGAILDTASLVNAAIDVPHDPRADLCIRAGYIALRRLADQYFIPYDPNPAPIDPISIDRSEFDAVCDQLAAIGVPLKSDRDQAWCDFAGWRVNYDTVLLALAALTMAPEAPWVSDRSLASPLRRLRAPTPGVTLRTEAGKRE